MKIVASNNAFVYDELGSPGFQLVRAEAIIVSSGDGALAAVAEHRPELLICDAELPGVDGYTACERVKADPLLRLTRVILVVHGAISAAQLQRLAACGCDDVVVFRVPGEDLYHRAARLLGLPDPSLGEPVKLHVSVSAGPDTEVSAHALALSPAAVDLLVPAPLAEQARVRLRLRRDGESAAVEVDGVVLGNQVDPASGGCITTVRFGELAVGDRARLADLALWEARRLPTGAVRVALRGSFDETTDFSHLRDHLGDEVVFDLSAVRLINSWGARHWVMFLRGLPAQTRYCFVNASTVFIKHCNMVADIMGSGKVLSFAAPYECGACGGEHDRVLQVSALSPAVRSRPPQFRCAACGGVDTFAEVPQRYFAFLRGE